MEASTIDEAAYDAALEHYQATHPLWDLGEAKGLVNHGTMASHALCVLGRADRIEALKAAYYPDLLQPFGLADEAPPRPSQLGRVEDLAAWIGWYDARLRSEAPLDVVREALVELAPGALAASLHGVIRTSHALRGFLRRDTPARRHELAYGLGLWAAEWSSLPEPTERATNGRRAAEVIRELVPVPAASRRHGLIGSRSLAVWDHPAFAKALGAIDANAAPVDQQLSELTDLFCELYLQAPSARSSYLHATTTTDGLRALLRLLAPVPARDVFRHVVTALAAVHASHAPLTDADRATEEPFDAPADAASLVDGAVLTNNDHTIKLVDAILREQALAPAPSRWRAAWWAVRSTTK